jgi:hypothetical protein
MKDWLHLFNGGTTAAFCLVDYLFERIADGQDDGIQGKGLQLQRKFGNGNLLCRVDKIVLNKF